MSFDKVCRYCSYFRNGVCTNDNAFKTVDEDGYEYIPGAELLSAMDMGEILEVLESVLDEDKIARTVDIHALRSEVDALLIRKLTNLADEFKKPSIAILEPWSFGCNQWR